MTTSSDKRSQTLAMGLMLFFPISFLVAVPWLKEQPEGTLYLVAGIAATGTVIASYILAVLKDNDLDEWQRGAARFSNQWGWLAGSGLVAILQSIPAFRQLVVDAACSLAAGTGSSDQQIVFAFFLGFLAVVLAQMLCILALNRGWRFWMSREVS